MQWGAYCPVHEHAGTRKNKYMPARKIDNAAGTSSIPSTAWWRGLLDSDYPWYWPGSKVRCPILSLNASAIMQSACIKIVLNVMHDLHSFAGGFQTVALVGFISPLAVMALGPWCGQLLDLTPRRSALRFIAVAQTAAIITAGTCLPLPAHDVSNRG